MRSVCRSIERLELATYVRKTRATIRFSTLMASSAVRSNATIINRSAGGQRSSLAKQVLVTWPSFALRNDPKLCPTRALKLHSPSYLLVTWSNGRSSAAVTPCCRRLPNIADDCRSLVLGCDGANLRLSLSVAVYRRLLRCDSTSAVHRTLASRWVLYSVDFSNSAT